MITILFNGEKRKIPEGTTLLSLVEELSYRIGTFAAAVNEIFIPKQQYADKIIQADDRIEIVMAMQGG